MRLDFLAAKVGDAAEFPAQTGALPSGRR